MGLITSNDFLTYTPTARAENASYPASNVTDKWHLIRQFKCSDATANDSLMVLDLSSAKTVSAIILSHVNFTSVTIEGNATDSWGSPSFTDTVAVSQDPLTERYNAFIPLTAFNYRYLRIFIPAAQTPTSDTVWFVGTICVLDSHNTLSKNYTSDQRLSDIPYTDIIVNNRTTDRISLSTLTKWEGSISFSKRLESLESEIFTLNSLNITTPIIFYENNDDTSRVYICLRDTAYQSSRSFTGVVGGNSIKFKEIGI